jgi:hypothetical protein
MWINKRKPPNLLILLLLVIAINAIQLKEDKELTEEEIQNQIDNDEDIGL